MDQGLQHKSDLRKRIHFHIKVHNRDLSIKKERYQNISQKIFLYFEQIELNQYIFKSKLFYCNFMIDLILFFVNSFSLPMDD